ncbi:hypothetical protein [Vibrio phage vB_VpP_BA6]|nr:hypothetical protein [Vibrio phage vB_VpP_BA6]
MAEYLILLVTAIVIIAVTVVLLERGHVEYGILFVLVGLLLYINLSLYIVSPMFEALFP